MPTDEQLNIFDRIVNRPEAYYIQGAAILIKRVHAGKGTRYCEGRVLVWYSYLLWPVVRRDCQEIVEQWLMREFGLVSQYFPRLSQVSDRSCPNPRPDIAEHGTCNIAVLVVPLHTGLKGVIVGLGL